MNLSEDTNNLQSNIKTVANSSIDLQELINVILDKLPTGISVKDPNDNFRYLYWNRFMETITGIKSEEIVGKDSRTIEKDFVWKKTQRSETDEVVLKSGTPFEFNGKIMNKDGELLDVEVTKSLITMKDGKTLLMTALKDATEKNKAVSTLEQMRLEDALGKAEAADRMKSKYLADMSHEIRTPLNAITGFAELMAFADTDEERLGYYEIIKTNNQLLMQLINDILDLSKIEADAVKIAYEMVDVSDLLDTVYASAKLRMRENVELIQEKAVKAYMFGTDPVRLMQLLNNLLNNAIKNTKSGSITVGYSILPDEQLRFYVRDTGIGIAEDKLANLFNRFVKLNDYVDGIGLGLAICRGLVATMKGSIHVESKLGEGSEFSFILPSHPVEE